MKRLAFFCGEWPTVKGGGKHFVSGTRQGAIASAAPAPARASDSPGVPPAPAVVPAPANVPQAAMPGKLDELREKAASLVDIALTPLAKESSASFQGYVMDLRESILDEAARKPVATPQAYTLAVQRCNMLIGTNNERTATVTRLNNNKPTNAAKGASTTRDHPNWQDLVRESQESARATYNNTIETPFHKGITVAWGLRVVELRKYLDAAIAQFRGALRQGAPPK